MLGAVRRRHPPGYFVALAGGQARRKTLIMIGGGDTCAEDLYLIIGPAAVKPGYNLLAQPSGIRQGRAAGRRNGGWPPPPGG